MLIDTMDTSVFGLEEQYCITGETLCLGLNTGRGYISPISVLKLLFK